MSCIHFRVCDVSHSLFTCLRALCWYLNCAVCTQCHYHSIVCPSACRVPPNRCPTPFPLRLRALLLRGPLVPAAFPTPLPTRLVSRPSCAVARFNTISVVIPFCQKIGV